MKRTNVVLDEKKVKAAKKACHIETTKDLLDFALTELLRMYGRERILEFKGKVPMDIDLDKSRDIG
jgi:hypothetical protein